MARTLGAVAEHSQSSVVALVGPWGSGKSTLAAAVVSQLRSAGWYVAFHNPWSYADYLSAVVGFFSSIRSAVPDDVLGKKWREDLGSWVTRLAPIGSVAQAVGVDATSAIGIVGGLVTGDQSPEALERKARAGLEKLQHPLLVVLDDLDRLEPAELLSTFRLVRLLGRLPNVYYFLAYDEDTIIDVLKRTGLVGNEVSRARQYLEKMVQVRLEIPQLLPEQQTSLVNAGVDDLLATHEITLTAEDEQRLQRLWVDCLVHYLDQPRAVKRLFTQVDAGWREVAQEVDFVDYIAVTFLRTFEKGCFDHMVAKRSELLQSSWLDHRDEPHKQTWARWIEDLKGAGARNPLAIACLLSEMFLVLRSARENTSYSGAWLGDVERRRGVGSGEFFDRYVQIGVPASDVSDRLVRDAVRELRQGQSGDAKRALDDFWETSGSRVVAKLERLDEVDELPLETLMMLGTHYPAVLDGPKGLFGASAEAQILHLAARLLERAPAVQASSRVIEFAQRSPSILLFLANVVRLPHSSEDGGLDHWSDLVRTKLGVLLGEHLRRLAQMPVEKADHLSDFLWAHFHVVGADETKEIVWDAIDTFAWSIEDLLGALLPEGTSSNGRDAWKVLGELSEGAVDEILGLDRVLDRLSDVEPAKRDVSVIPWGVKRSFTVEDRRARAEWDLWTIRQRKAEALRAAGANPHSNPEPVVSPAADSPISAAVAEGPEKNTSGVVQEDPDSEGA